MLTRTAFAISLAPVCSVNAQEALWDDRPTLPPMLAARPPVLAVTPPTGAEPLPSSAWLDLHQTTSRNSKTQEAPAWVEALTLLPAQPTEGSNVSKSVFRIRVTPPGPDYKILFFRLFFDDKPNQ